MQFDELQSIVEKQLNEAFSPSYLLVKDQSHLHTGHGAPGSHVHVTIHSEAFVGVPLLKRHQMVYETLGPLVGNEIHAIVIRALEPEKEA